jgi:hypothetical protein
MRNTFIIVLFICVIFGQEILAGSGGPYVLEWTTIDAGGGTSSGGEYTLTGTIGQHDAGTLMTGENFSLTGGFWPGRQTPVCIVNLEHFADFAARWLDLPCDPGNDFCDGADLDMLGDVDMEDMKILAYWWLDYCPEDWPLK